MVMDSLRYWVESYGIDGFRFDLGVTLGREHHGFDPNSGFFDALMQDPVLGRLKLISEPWDVGIDGYQLGNHPAGMAEWNADFRDGIRRFWAGEPGMRASLPDCFLGSPSLFDRRFRRPWASVQYVASHDGYTARDLVTYAEKHNEANGDDNSDGHDANYSNNWGVEGPTDDVQIEQTRMRVLRSMLASVMLANGTPMLLAGDEFGNSQDGNNNAYCQDNAISWLDWSLASADEGRALIKFVAQLTRARRDDPSVRLDRYEDGSQEVGAGLSRVAWFDLDGQPMTQEGWDFPEGRVLGLRRAVRRDDARIQVSLVLVNGGDEDVTFQMPVSPELIWERVIDTADPDGGTRELVASGVPLAAHSLVLLRASHDAIQGGSHDTA